ncbi:hypothetical protein H0H93_014687, partial [Arthromyces matolae]
SPAAPPVHERKSNSPSPPPPPPSTATTAPPLTSSTAPPPLTAITNFSNASPPPDSASTTVALYGRSCSPHSPVYEPENYVPGDGVYSPGPGEEGWTKSWPSAKVPDDSSHVEVAVEDSTNPLSPPPATDAPHEIRTSTTITTEPVTDTARSPTPPPRETTPPPPPPPKVKLSFQDYKLRKQREKEEKEKAEKEKEGESESEVVMKASSSVETTSAAMNGDVIKDEDVEMRDVQREPEPPTTLTSLVIPSMTKIPSPSPAPLYLDSPTIPGLTQSVAPASNPLNIVLASSPPTRPTLHQPAPIVTRQAKMELIEHVIPPSPIAIPIQHDLFPPVSTNSQATRPLADRIGRLAPPRSPPE